MQDEYRAIRWVPWIAIQGEYHLIDQNKTWGWFQIHSGCMTIVSNITHFMPISWLERQSKFWSGINLLNEFASDCEVYRGKFIFFFFLFLFWISQFFPLFIYFSFFLSTWHVYVIYRLRSFTKGAYYDYHAFNLNINNGNQQTVDSSSKVCWLPPIGCLVFWGCLTLLTFYFHSCFSGNMLECLLGSCFEMAVKLHHICLPFSKFKPEPCMNAW